MIFWFDSFFIYFMMGVTLLVSVIGLWFTAIMPGIDRWSKRFFRSLFTLFILLNIIGFLDTIIYIYPVPMWIMYLMIILESVLLSLSLLMMTAYLLHCCGENVRSNRLFHAVLGLWGVFVVMLTIPLFTEVFYYFTPDGRYWRGAWYPVLLLPMIIAMLLTIAGMIRWRERLSRKAFLSFLITLLPITCVLVMDMFIELYPLIDISIVISALSMYSLILSDQIEQDLQRQREIANQRASIMVLQMRPHFIYNTMTSIYCLCKQDPQLAQQVIMDFTTYLRKNFSAISSATPITFSSELEHTRAYLAVEQAQYEDSLFVDYDIQHKYFRVPPLTLQPIVENAIKHGRDPYAGPFRISIRTRKTDSGSEIVVADNGRGFDPADDSEPHIALKNIQERLEMMCNGEMTITPNDGGGTVVTVIIPDR
ncbi:MAG: histidine kinase [Synergistaceae bacterium]|nr:histidine kinase [Synergistaceae bacterium]MBQ6981247.1 histidine kinase [Synergistaceae bacterium]MBR0248323.1 histidine kinase [Synergistaceae bacterium]